MYKMRLNARAAKYIVLILSVIVPLPAMALCESFWQPRILAQAASASVELRDNRRAVATVPTRWFIALDHINKRINAVSGIDAHFLLCSSPQPNAMAWRGNGKSFVALTLGMYRLLGDDWHAYAAILGHENAHLARRHGSKRQTRETAGTIAQLLGRSLLAGKTAGGSALVSESMKIGTRAVTSNYSRAEEHEADKYGMHYAHRAGFDPRGALSFHAKIKSAGHFLSSHPSSADRIRRLEAELKKNGW
ncbi:MAG: M48 family metalloprotease [Gammaproteobacteria bacterium]|nr:M48 family metalloprotease [Gammaproteobacteria bacterium]MDD9875779.1 M48 family metalloprotease [Gammaproteobacteria bacterium]